MTEPASGFRPNIVLIMADQLRRDVLGCYGNPLVQTPNLDRLAEEGVRLDHFFSQSTLCQPSRASIATGRYPHSHGVKANWYDLPRWEVTLQATLSDAGYHTYAMGKMHFEPTNELHGFRERIFVEGKMFSGDDEYRLHLKKLGRYQEYLEHVARWDNQEDFGAQPSPFDPDDYIDIFLANRTVEAMAAIEEPFFSWVSFVNPHMPFDPPRPFDRMYDPADVPLPEDWGYRQDSRIPEHRTSSGGSDFSRLGEAQVRRARALYYGQVSMVDECVGRVLKVIADRGLRERTVVMFTTDHGEFLGHRGMLWKGGQMLYDHLLQLPFIVRFPGELPAGKVVSDLLEEVDIMPTCLEYAGVPIPEGVQGSSMARALRQEAGVVRRDSVFAEGREVKMLRDYDWKVILYPNRRYGELYRVGEDRLELHNLWSDPGYAGIRGELLHRLASSLALTEDPLPRPTRRPGYFEMSGFHPAQELT